MLPSDEEQAIRSIIDEIPILSGYRGPIVRLGGLTNRVYQLSDAVLRVPGPGTEDYINRSNEAVAARIAAEARVSPDVLFADAASGLMVTRLISDAVTMSPGLFRSRVGSPARAGQAFLALHESGGKFPFRFELFAMIDDYLNVLAGTNVQLPVGYHDVVKDAQRVGQTLARNPVPLVPCHCDPLCENFLDVGTRMWMVDWEYSGMNDPMWDLGDLSVEAEFDDDQDMEMLVAYFGGTPPPADHARMVIYKAMCDLLWTLWGLIQHANNNPAEDFAAYAENRFSRCKALMRTAGFADHLEAI